MEGYDCAECGWYSLVPLSRTFGVEIVRARRIFVPGVVFRFATYVVRSLLQLFKYYVIFKILKAFGYE